MIDTVLLGNNIRTLRKAKSIKQVRVSIDTDINYTTYSKYENGERIPTLRDIIAIANYFNVSIGSLLYVGKKDFEREYIIDEITRKIDKINEIDELKLLESLYEEL